MSCSSVLPFLDGGFDHCLHSLQYLETADDVGTCRNHSVTRNDLRVVRNLRKHELQRLDERQHPAAEVAIAEGCCRRHEHVPQANDIRVLEEDDDVAIGMPWRQLQQPNLFAIEVQGDLAIKRDDRQRLGRTGLVASDRIASRHSRPHGVMRDDGRKLLEEGVAARMVAVRMRVDYESDRLAREALRRHEQFVRDFRTTGVDHDDSVVAGGNRDVAFIALQHADGAANRHDRESGVGICRAGGCHQTREK